jgi:hypothetical protein
MKLRFSQNSVRLRLNRREVEDLSTGLALKEYVHFPGDAQFGYVLESALSASPQVEFGAGTVRVAIPWAEIQNWASTDAIGMYFELPANGSMLKLAIEKDLECIDGPAAERDPEAFPRSGKNC